MKLKEIKLAPWQYGILFFAVNAGLIYLVVTTV